MVLLVGVQGDDWNYEVALSRLQFESLPLASPQLILSYFVKPFTAGERERNTGAIRT